MNETPGFDHTNSAESPAENLRLQTIQGHLELIRSLLMIRKTPLGPKIPGFSADYLVNPSEYELGFQARS